MKEKIKRLSLNPMNPLFIALRTFSSATKVTNIVTNDFIKEQLENRLNEIDISELFYKIHNKYINDEAELKAFVELMFRLMPSIKPLLININLFAEMMMRQSEIVARMSSQNKSTSYSNDYWGVASQIFKNAKWIDDHNNELIEKYNDRIFEPHIFDFCEATRLNVYDLNLQNMNTLNSFNQKVIISFETTKNIFEANKPKLDIIDDKLKVKAERTIIDVLSYIVDYNSFEILTTAAINSDLISNVNEVGSACDEFVPFVQTPRGLYTNATLMGRFISRYIDYVCESSKRYQIHSGFIFEKILLKSIDEDRYQNLDVKRINRREFDVVLYDKFTKKIINIQCKNFANNIYSFKSLKKSKAKLNSVMSRLASALVKEEQREDVLRNEMINRGLNFSSIKHIVVSKIPIPSNCRIMDLNYFIKKFNA